MRRIHIFICGYQFMEVDLTATSYVDYFVNASRGFNTKEKKGNQLHEVVNRVELVVAPQFPQHHMLPRDLGNATFLC